MRENMKPLPLGSIKPSGWLKGQLRRHADGVTGKLDECGTFVPQSPWLVAGGTGEDWERVPYWLDGLVAAAWTLDDPALKAMTPEQRLAAARAEVKSLFGTKEEK